MARRRQNGLHYSPSEKRLIFELGVQHNPEVRMYIPSRRAAKGIYHGSPSPALLDTLRLLQALFYLQIKCEAIASRLDSKTVRQKIGQYLNRECGINQRSNRWQVYSLVQSNTTARRAQRVKIQLRAPISWAILVRPYRCFFTAHLLMRCVNGWFGSNHAGLQVGSYIVRYDETLHPNPWQGQVR